VERARNAAILGQVGSKKIAALGGA